jgi:hypothetical protein
LAAILIASCGNSGDDSADNNNTPGSTQAPGATTTTADLSKKVPVDAPGVTDSEIRVSVIASVTNPIGGNYGGIADGINAYFDMMNADGGIYGRQLKLVKVRDDAAGNNQAQAQATVSQDNVFATFVAALLFTAPTCSHRPTSRRSAGTSTRSGPARRTSSRTRARCAWAVPAQAWCGSRRK